MFTCNSYVAPFLLHIIQQLHVSQDKRLFHTIPVAFYQFGCTTCHCSFVKHNAITGCGLNETDMTEDEYVCVDRRGRKEEMQATLSDPHTPVSRHFRTTDKARLSSYLSIYLPQFVFHLPHPFICFNSRRSQTTTTTAAWSQGKTPQDAIVSEPTGQCLTPTGPASRTGLKKQIRRRPACHESLNICEAR